ncbi:uncharacterized protein LOC131351571 [Hemibagrus wyckioides]|uniref:uncharacterized protein LOC131351571 n=1 Tax=Hemibagrus wyckioides TaxID=337641 RepID=UPI00266CC87E|nr:uncharacterized protein LOC131351571 [Hemibagrus wyckioides]
MSRECEKLQIAEMNLQEEQHKSGSEKRPDSPVSSCVSLKSDKSMPIPLNFKGGTSSMESGTEKRPDSPVSSCVSFKSDNSMPLPLNFTGGTSSIESGTGKRPDSPVPSYVSFKSDTSMPVPLNFTGGTSSMKSGSEKRQNSPVPSCESFKMERRNSSSSTQPKHPTRTDKKKEKHSKERDDPEKAFVRSLPLDKKIPDFLHNIFMDLENKMIVFIKHELEMFKKFLRKENTKYYQDVRDDLWSVKEAALDMALYFLKLMEHNDLADALQDALIGFQQRALKSNLGEKFHQVWEGIAKQGESNILNKIYTDLYITAGGVRQMNKQHEVRQIEKQKTSVKAEETQMEQEEQIEKTSVKTEETKMEQEQQIECKNMFKPSPGEEKPIRTVVTQGVAGIGKSICVQKFVLDWAEGKEYQDIKFILPLPFRELNLKDEKRSLRDIIYQFFPSTKGMRLTDKYKVMFIFDGLDECRLPLTFHKNQKLTDVTEKASLDTIMTNLIEGNLLPSALIWITTRPAAAAKIPAEHVDRVTEVRGFNDVQKVEYFRKKISVESLANRIIDHIKGSRSLFIMCHIPVFCWISATVLERILGRSDSEDIPQTLTEMYTCFLIFQTVQGDKKYNRNNASDIPWDKEGILSLGKLAFIHLEKNNLIFYAEDLKACGIDPSNLAVYSGVCTQETGRFLGTVFSFVHLSIQEFIAALFTYTCVRNENKNVFDQSEERKETQLIDFLKITVDKALKSENGHLDLFLRFLLGLSVESNQKLIRGLLTHTGSSSDCRKDIVKYIKFKFEQNPSPERLINLFYCLNELNDDSLVKEIQSYMNSGRLSEAELSPAQWSALVFVLLTSEENLEVFDLQKFIRSDECFKRLLPVVQEATTVLLSECNLTERSCWALHTVLSSESSKLTEVDLSSNPLEDSGVKLLCAGLKSPNCKLEKLRSALKSSHLIELDLRGNDPGASGVKLLTDLLQDPDCTLNTLSLLKSPDAVKACDSLTEVLGKNPLLQRELDLSGKIKGDSGVKQLSALLKDPHCRTETLMLKDCSITEEGCSALTSSFHSNPAHIREMDLSENKFGNSGVQKLCALLQHQSCNLQILRLSDCSITEEGYTALAEALKSSHLIELDLRGNDPGASGVKLLTDLLQDPDCTLNTLRLLKSPEAEEAFKHLNEVLDTNPLLQTDLNLSGKIKGDSGVKQLSVLLKDSHCRAETLMLIKCGLMMESCITLAEVLSSPLCFLTELDLSENSLQNSGVMELSKGLKDPCCNLKILRLSDCSITEEGYTALAEALKSSHLIELDLRGNDPGASGVKKLDDIQNNPNYKLETLRLLKSSAAQEACDWLNSVVDENSLLLKELDLSRKETGDSGVEKLSALMEDSHCKFQKIKLSDCSITEEGYTALAEALKSSHLIELDLRGNDPGASGVKLLTDLLQDPDCTLNTLSLLKSPDAVKACDSLTEVLGKNPLLQRELDLSGKIKGDSGVKQLSALLKDPHCRTETLMLKDCSITEEGCSALTSSFHSNPAHIREMDLSENKFGNSGVQKLCALLQHQSCNLQILRLSDCSITEEGYTALAEALKSSHLIELDLRGNDPGASGVKLLTDLLQDPDCTLNTLRLLKGPEAEEAFKHLNKVLDTNPLLQTDLNLSGKIKGDSGVKQLSALLKDSHCRAETLMLIKCGLMMESCITLAEVLSSPLCFLTELDLSENSLQNSGVMELSKGLKDPCCNLKILRLSDCSITEEGYTALAEALKSSHLIELDLRGNDPGASGVKKLDDIQNNPNYKLETLRLLKSSAAQEACDWLNSVVDENSLLLKELDLSRKETGDSGVEKLSALMEDSHCKFQKIKLSDCSITEEGYTALAEALKSSHLIELDLRGNDPGASGVKLLTDLLQDPDCTLNTLSLLKSPDAVKACDSLTEVLGKNPLLQRELDLSGKIKGDSGVKQLSALLKDSHCRTETLMLKDCSITEEGCSALTSSFHSNPAHIREMDLSENKFGNSGVQKLCALLQHQSCNLQILRLSDCSITEEGYTALAEALKSSHLIELDLRGNDPGASGVKLLTDLLQDPDCTLNTLRLLKSPEAEEAFKHLNKVLDTNPLLQTDLNLSGKIKGDSGVKQLSVLLKDSHCRAETLMLIKCGLMMESCITLAEVLSSPLCFLTELDLSENSLQNSGVMELSKGLKDPCCNLKILRLSDCSITEEGYTALAEALKSSHLIELDLRGNDPGASGVKKLDDIQNNPNYKLETLRLLKSSAAQEACDWLNSVVDENSLLLKELDLSRKETGDSGVEKLSALMEDSHCKFQKIKLSDCSITEEGYTALAEALKSSHLIELDLRGNDPGASGVKLLTDLLQDPDCTLNTLSLLKSPDAVKACDSLTEVLGKNPLLQRELDLSGKIKGDSGVKQLSALLKDPHCRTETLMLKDCSITEEGCSALTSSFHSNPAHIREMDLSENKFGNSGVQKLCALLQHQSCNLQILRLSDCSITEEGYTALAEALKSSHLIELDLRGNDPGASGVKLLTDLLQDPDCTLNTLRLLKGPEAEEAFKHLNKVLDTNPLLQTDLNLSGKIKGDSGVKQLSALLKDSHCRAETLMLIKCGLMMESCITLAEVLSSPLCFLTELDLSENSLQNSGVMELSKGLKDPCCNLKILRLSDCSITEEGYTALAEALKSSHLIELDLRGNDPGASGVKKLDDIQNNPNYKLETLRLLKSSAAQEACDWLNSVVDENSLLLKELDLSRKETGDSGVEKLSALMEDSHCKFQKINLSECNLTERSCSILHTVLSSESSKLTEVDLSSNPLEDSGVKLLCAGLKSPNCELETLRLSDCSITEEGYTALAEALKSSHLIELDLRGNDPGASGVKLLTDLLQDPDCTLNTLSLLKSPDAVKACDSLTEVLGKNPLLQRELDLSGKIKGDSGVKQLSALLKDPHCRTETLMLKDCSITEEGCSALTSSFHSNPAHIREMDLSENKFGNSGVQKLCALLQHQSCNLQILRLSDCSITEEGYTALAEALKSSHLIELDLRGNDPGASGVKLLTDLLQDPDCTLNTLRLLKGPEAEEAFKHLNKVLDTNPLLQTDLNLSGKIKGDSGVKQLSALLKDSHCRAETLMLIKCGLMMESCITLAEVLSSPLCFLTELDLSENSLQNSGVMELSKGLKDPCCNLKILRLSDCSITEEGYTALAEALKSSHLIELDLRGNDPGASGVKKLDDIQNNPNYKLETLRLLKSSAAQEACDWLNSVVDENSLLLKELDLSRKETGDSGVEKLSALMEDSHCKFQKINLSECNLTERSCSILHTVLSSESSKLTEVDLSSNPLEDSGVKLLCAGLKSPNCELETLRLSDCSITEEGYTALAEALKSSHLIELDLRGNDPGASGVKLLTDLLQDPDCTLNTLSLLKSPDAVKACDSLTEVLGKNPLLQRELDLSGKIKGDSGVKQLSALLKDPHCRTETLMLKDCSITEEGCSALTSSFHSNPAHIREMDLSENKFGNSGVQKLCALLQHQSCNLQILRLSDCSITEEGYTALAEALKSSHLIELDLRGNDPGASGVKLLTDLLQDPDCTLNTLRLLKGPEAEEAFKHLNKVLDTNPLLQTDLNLSGKIKGDSGVKQLSALLKDSHCRAETLMLIKCGLMMESCITLAEVLSSPLCFLTELDLSENSLQNSGVMELSKGLKDPCCNLKILRLSDCSITEEGYTALAEALKSSHLIELDLRGNDPGASGVKKLDDIQNNPNYKLETLRLLKSSAAQEACDWLNSVVDENSLLLKELDLSRKETGDSGVEKLSALMEDSHCKFQKINLSECNLTERSCSILHTVLSSESSKLTEVDLSSNPLEDSGVKLLCAGLKSPNCELETLRLSDCSITEEGYTALAEALKSSHLIELDLRGNDPGASGVKLLTDLLQDPDCTLNTLRLLKSPEAEEAFKHLNKVLDTNPLLQTDLNLSGKIKGDSGVKQLSVLLKDSHCRAETLMLIKCGLMMESCITLAEVLSSPLCFLTELDLSENSLQNSGVMELSKGLKNPCCNLKILRLSDCSITEEGYTALSEALKSSHLIELDLRGNDPGASGVKKLDDIQNNPNYKLQTLRLLKSSAAQEACDWLNSVVDENSLLLKELDLSRKETGDSGVEKLSALMEDSHCKFQKIKLSDCSITEEGYTALAEALKSSHLIELDLRGNDPGASGVKLLTDLLQDPDCTLNTLRLLKSSAAEEACDWLNPILTTNPLLLKELDLSRKEPGDSGVKQLSALLEDSHCKFQKIKLNKCNLTVESCSALASALKLQSCSVRDLDLSNNSLQDPGVTQLSAGLKHHHCKLEILRLNTCDVMGESCSALAEVLSSECSRLRELDLSNNSLQDPGVTQLSAGLKHHHCKLEILRLNTCSITDGSSSALAEVLSSEYSRLRELDLSNNSLQDSGVTQLSAGLKNPQSALTILNLMDNNIREEGYTALAEALKSSHLIELDLRGNDPGASGVKLLTDLLQDPDCTLDTLRLLKSSAAQEGCDLLSRVLGVNPLLQRELNVSEKISGDSQVKQLSALLEDSHCRPEILKVNNSRMTNEGCAALASALGLNPSHLRELELSGNKLGGSGMKELCGVLKNQQFKLLKLGLCKCSLTEDDCTAVVSALRTNPSHLKELDLSHNTIGDTGMKQISDLLQNSNCTLETLRLNNCSLTQTQCDDLAKTLESNSSSSLKELDLRGNYRMSGWNIFRYFLGNSNSKLFIRILSPEAEEVCDYLTKVLGTNPLLQRELDLSGKISGDSGVKQLSVLLKDPQCRPEKLRLNKSSITHRGCTDLISALTSNPSHLTELDLSENTLGNSVMDKISTLLKNSSCKLQKLILSDCNITEKGYTALFKALNSNHSSLTELDLRGNDPGASGLMELRNLMNDRRCKLKTLRVLKSPDAQKASDHLTEVLGINPILQTDLNLSGKIKGDSGVEQLSVLLKDLLKDPHCRPETLQLSECNLTEKGCSALLTALRSEHSTLKELNLSKNRIQDSGVKLLSEELKNKLCKLETLRWLKSPDAEEAYTCLTKMFSKTPYCTRSWI